MYTKLTLRLDEHIINQIKNYAAEHKMSLSKMVEQYFRSLVSKKNKEEISPLVKELSGCIKVDREINEKEEITKYLMEKYL